MYLLWNASGFQVLDGKRIGFLKGMVMEREKDPVSESAAGKSGIRQAAVHFSKKFREKAQNLLRKQVPFGQSVHRPPGQRCGIITSMAFAKGKCVLRRAQKRTVNRPYREHCV